MPNATAKPLDNGGYLVNTPGQHPGIVDTQGTHTHDAVWLHWDNVSYGWAALPLRGDDPFALTSGGEPWRELTLVADATGITRHAANTHAIQFFDWAGNYRALRLTMTDGRLAGHEIHFSRSTTRAYDAGSWGVTADGQVVDGAHVRNLFIVPDPHFPDVLVTIPGRDPVVIDSRSGDYLHHAELPSLPNGVTEGVAVWPSNGSGRGTLYDGLGPVPGSGVVVSDGRLAITYSPGVTTFHRLDGTLESTVRSGQGRDSFTGYRFELTELPDGTVTAQVIHTGTGAPVAGVTLRPFGTELNMIDAPGVGRALLGADMEHSHAVVQVPGAQDRLVALPIGTDRTGPSDDFWMDGAALRAEDDIPDATFFAADGTFLGYAHRTPDGPLGGNIFAVPRGSDTPFVVRPDGTPLPGAPVRPLELDDQFLIDVPGGGHVTLSRAVLSNYDVVPLPGRDGNASNELALLPNNETHHAPFVVRTDRLETGGAMTPAPYVTVRTSSETAEGADGTAPIRTLEITTGSLAGFRFVDSGDGAPRLLGPGDHPVPGATVTPLGEGWYTVRSQDNSYAIARPALTSMETTRPLSGALSGYSLFLPPGGGLPDVADAIRRPVEGARLERLADDMFLIEVDNVGRQVVNSTGAHTHDAVRQPNPDGTPGDIVRAYPLDPDGHPTVHRGGQDISDDAWSDDDTVTIESGPHTTEHSGDGALAPLETLAPLSGTLSRFSLFLPPGGGLPDVADAIRRPVEGARVERLADDMFLIEVDNVGRQVVNSTGAHTHDAVRPPNPDGTPGDIVRAYPLDPDGHPTVHRGGQDISDRAWSDDNTVT
ncbi:hypothetical protein, partial [Streptomyces radicis]|uniref:hypothetical protein n=1 Tax=Streptomyces radicis TaxID=1750517 RepID=UPI0015FEF984